MSHIYSSTSFLILTFAFVIQSEAQFVPTGAGFGLMRPAAQAGETVATNTNAVMRYMEMIGLRSYEDGNIGRNNQGLVNHFQRRFNSSPCFQDLAAEFYNEINLRDEALGSPPSHLEGRPTLADSVGRGRFSNLDNGWLWRRAMQFANNNPNLAMELIGICGHDDVEQGQFEYLDRSARGQAAQQREIDILEQELADLPSNGNHSNQAYTLNSRIASLRAQLNDGVPSAMNCPAATSVMYAPGSLGVDISDSLKNQIASVQSPTRGEAGLPAKYYHVLGSAYMACQLVQQGMSGPNATSLQELAATSYRTVRLCQSTRAARTQRSTLLDYYQQNRGVSRETTRRGQRVSGRESHEDFFLRIAQGQRDQNNYINCRIEVKNQGAAASQECRMLDAIGFAPDRAYSDAQIRSRIAGRFDDYNAAHLYGRWHPVCSPVRLAGSLRPSSEYERPDGVRGPSGNACIEGFSVAACDAARNRLRTWEEDALWTETQHRTGAGFAANHCTRNTRPMEELACEARDARGSGRNSSPTQRQQGVQ